jgi:hypothetical protein
MEEVFSIIDKLAKLSQKPSAGVTASGPGGTTTWP